MVQVRYGFSGSRALAERVFAALETVYEEEGAPIAIVEIDEAAAIFEVSAYLETAEGEDRREEFARAASEAGGEPVEVWREDLPTDVDWMAQVLADLRPVRAGRFLVHGSHDRDKVLANDLAIEIDAGQAFGTGHHGTTAGCLEMIERVVRRRRVHRALDLGTGSAVLAIGLAKLARIPVLATDIDPVAVRVAQENAARNGVDGLVYTAVAAGFGAPAIRQAAPFDLVVANILARPLQALAPQFARHIVSGGEAILSGILVGQRRAVIASYVDAGFAHRQTITRGDWVTIRLSR